MPTNDANGDIPGRILQSLSKCDNATLDQMQKKDMFNFAASRFSPAKLSGRNIRLDKLEEYAKITNSSVSYYLFGDDAPPMPPCVPNDKSVIAVLNNMSDSHLMALRDAIYDFFPSPLQSLPNDPAKRLLAAFDANKNVIAANLDYFAFRSYDQSIFNAEIDRWRKRNFDLGFRFSLDSYPTISAYLGITLHWVFSLKTPLYMESQLAESVFDLYTLMKQSQWSEFCRLLLYLKDKDLYAAISAPCMKVRGTML